MPEAEQSRRALRFGVFEVELATSELHKNGLKVKLQEQPFQVLALLLERPGEVVTREEICQKLWPDGTFVEFDRSLNIAVNKLRDALGDSAGSPRFVETVPRRGYRFVGPIEVVGAAVAEAETPVPRQHLWSPRRAAWIAIVVVVAAAAVFLVRQWYTSTPIPVSAPVPLTSYRGHEVFPAFSPDGKDVAFSWDGDQEDNFNIYRRQIGPGEALLQLTDDPADDLCPAWSPDGRSIAFVRVAEGGKGTVIVLPAMPGVERPVADVSAVSRRSLMYAPGFRALNWSPDGRWLAIVDRVAPDKRAVAIFLLSLETGVKRRLISPPDFAYGDASPAFSPDGRGLAFCRMNQSNGTGDLYVVRLSRQLEPLDAPRRIAAGFNIARNPVWTRNGKEIIFVGANSSWVGGLWRAPVSGSGSPERLSGVQSAEFPAVSNHEWRLAYEQREHDWTIWRLELSTPGATPGPPRRFIASTRGDGFPRYSPDGRRIVFESRRTGVEEIWICNSDGSKLQQLTVFGSGWSGSPDWSPDGRRIVFDRTVDGQWELFIIPASGGASTRLTNHPASDYAASWSHDGRWIYFTSDRSGTPNVWKTPVGGGEAVQITRNGGDRARESMDGTRVFYRKGTTLKEASLWEAPAAGGAEVQLVAPIRGPGFTVFEDGIYLMRAPDAKGKFSVQFYRFSDRQARPVAPFDGLSLDQPVDVSVSPDRRYVLCRLRERSGADLMLVENFR